MDARNWNKAAGGKTVPPCTAEDDESDETEDDNAPVVRRMTTADNRVFAFADTDRIKKKVRKKAKKIPIYNVHNAYFKEGWCQALARHPHFENFTLGVIVVNAIWIAIDTDWNFALTLLDADAVFIVADCLFFSYFVFELAVRFGAFKHKRSCLNDAWFVFDTSLVTLYLFDPFLITLASALSGGDGLDLPTSLLRLFRLARLSRLVRMLKSLPELMIMVKGIISAAASVSYMLGLLVIVTYIFAIALTQLSLGTEFREIYFKGVSLSMYTLFIYGTFLDSLNDFVDAVKAESGVCLAVLAIFAVISALTLLNMLIGVLCEVVSAISSTEKEQILTEKVRDKFGKIIGDIDKDGDMMISWAEVSSMAEHKDAAETLASVNINMVDMIEIAEDFIFTGVNNQQKSLTFQQFMAMALDCRNTHTAVIRDVMVLRKRFNRKISDLKEVIGCVGIKLDALIERNNELQSQHSAKAEEVDSTQPWEPAVLFADQSEVSGDTQTVLASTKIQATYRGHRTRRQLLQPLHESRPATSEDSATRVSPTNDVGITQALIRNDEEADQSAHSGASTTGHSVEHLCRLATAELAYSRQSEEAVPQTPSAQEAAQRMFASPNCSEMQKEPDRTSAEPPQPGLPGQMANAEELQ